MDRVGRTKGLRIADRYLHMAGTGSNTVTQAGSELSSPPHRFTLDTENTVYYTDLRAEETHGCPTEAGATQEVRENCSTGRRSRVLAHPQSD